MYIGGLNKSALLLWSRWSLFGGTYACWQFSVALHVFASLIRCQFLLSGGSWNLAWIGKVSRTYIDEGKIDTPRVWIVCRLM
jgi:hypothetical protein